MIEGIHVRRERRGVCVCVCTAMPECAAVFLETPSIAYPPICSAAPVNVWYAICLRQIHGICLVLSPELLAFCFHTEELLS